MRFHFHSKIGQVAFGLGMQRSKTAQSKRAAVQKGSSNLHSATGLLKGSEKKFKNFGSKKSFHFTESSKHYRKKNHTSEWRDY